MLQFLSPVLPGSPDLSARGHVRTPGERPDLTIEQVAILEQVRPYTMTSEERVVALIDAIGYLAEPNPRRIVECGVWRGGSSMAAALALQAAGDTGRELYLYDTFEGMTNPTVVDRSYDGLPAADQLSAAPAGTGVWCRRTGRSAGQPAVDRLPGGKIALRPGPRRGHAARLSQTRSPCSGWTLTGTNRPGMS